ncbi:MAG TPA: hypothetical protein PLQ20_00390 [Candidatus Paceibacterota bacterium]|nr:hypothetical protein [Candidatus Paceibacterota bacterium]
MTPITLLELFNLVNKVAPVSKESYPGLEKLDLEQKISFVLSHKAHHFSMASGKFAKIAHDLHHSPAPICLDKVKLKKQVASIFFTVITTAHFLEMKPEELLAETEKLAKEYGEEFKLM